MKSCYLHVIPSYFIQLSHSRMGLLQQIAFPYTWFLKFLIFLSFSWMKIMADIFFWVLHLVCIVRIRRFVSKVHIMCIHWNYWFYKIIPHGRGHLGNNFEIAIPINHTGYQDIIHNIWKKVILFNLLWWQRSEVAHKLLMLIGLLRIKNAIAVTKIFCSVGKHSKVSKHFSLKS